MTSTNFERTLPALRRRIPFRPFIVELVSGDRIEVDHPEALVYRAGVALYISREGQPVVFDHESVSQLVGEKSPGQPNGKRPRPRKGS